MIVFKGPENLIHFLLLDSHDCISSSQIQSFKQRDQIFYNNGWKMKWTLKNQSVGDLSASGDNQSVVLILH